MNQRLQQNNASRL